MRIYLDNCCYNRHHDKKVSDEITQDKNSVIAIQILSSQFKKRLLRKISNLLRRSCFITKIIRIKIFATGTIMTFSSKLTGQLTSALTERTIYQKKSSR